MTYNILCMYLRISCEDLDSILSHDFIRVDVKIRKEKLCGKTRNSNKNFSDLKSDSDNQF